MPCGSRREACVIADWTSMAAPSRLRFRSNSSVTSVDPSEFTDVIDSSPAISENWFSSGVATDEPIVSGLAPGSCAVTSSVGKSTFGRSLTGSDRYATSPNSAIAAISKLVAMGRLMKPSEMFITLAAHCGGHVRNLARLEDGGHIRVDHWRQVQCDQLRDHQAAYDREAERAPRFAACAVPERNRQRAEQCRHRRHHDGSETNDAAFINRVERRFVVLAFGFERK